MRFLRTRAMWWAVKEWCERVIYCHHNARVLADMEYRMSCLLDTASGGQMSKAYYDWPTMRIYVQDHHTSLYQNGWDDACKAHGIVELAESYGDGTSPDPSSSEGGR